MNAKHVAIYLRVSTKQQGTESQEPDLDRWVKAQDKNTTIHVYKDKFTGKSMSRPQWDRLQAAIGRGEVSSIVVWRLDRLGRTASGLTKLFDELRTRKVNLISLRDGVDLETPAGRLMANVLASVAQYETEVRAERTLAGQAVARAKGKTWGGSKPGRLQYVTPEQVAIVHQMVAEHASKSAIARATGLSRPTIYNLLANHAAA